MGLNEDRLVSLLPWAISAPESILCWIKYDNFSLTSLKRRILCFKSAVAMFWRYVNDKVFRLAFSKQRKSLQKNIVLLIKISKYLSNYAEVLTKVYYGSCEFKTCVTLKICR